MAIDNKKKALLKKAVKKASKDKEETKDHEDTEDSGEEKVEEGALKGFKNLKKK